MPKMKKCQKVHVYARLSYHGVTPLFFVEGTSGAKGIGTSINGRKYVNILENCLFPAFRNMMEVV